ncbi:PREDICTED: tRNA dimethylallyltransferase, mitochondrial [Papilio xuthus]|uniref:tRNA dimethylallyltransferase, mitochondrial n=2 Tax=Papilio xuthus TaxID=66420 RepID=A0AAJ6ZHG2_PAPXU|nr:PREDICTED: tRNA dimethylallyltransferase, mitochondrial [Papilio xuthus]
MMALRSVISSKIPMVIILGATGTGKTKLSLELAQKFETEIISADSMQVYKGLDIVTAKASHQERELVPHHLLDLLEPHQMFTVVDFRNRALKIIENLTEKGKIPIIVGGTNYYIESIVYQILVEDMTDSKALLWDVSKRKRDYNINESQPKKLAVDCESNIKEKLVSDVHEVKNVIDKQKLQEDVDNETNFSNEEIHAKLKAIDPVMASRLHPNNRRKVLRSIELWLKTGRRHSEVLDEQKLSEGQLRRPDATIVLWLKCEQTIHDERLNARVDSMLKEGLIQELLNFHDRHNKQRIKDDKPPDYTKGVFQTLGLKEFHEYLMMTEDERNSEDGKKLMLQSIDNMKIATRRYARRQNKMVKGRFLEIPTREVPTIYELDTTDLSQWDKQVKNKAIEIIESYINKIPCPYEPLKKNIDEEKKKINSQSSNYCDVCERLIIGDKEYTIHLNSFKHQRVLKKKKRLLDQKTKEVQNNS